MLDIVGDTHTHSLICGHAYSTIGENIAVAKEKGLRFLIMTEHSQGIPGAPGAMYFQNQRTIPDVVDDVIILKGAEVNIMDCEGNLDLKDSILERLDWVIASMHIPCLKPSTTEDHTENWLKVAANPLVDVIGHCGDARFAFDYEAVIPVFASSNKIVEINNHSFDARPGSEENCLLIAKLCKKHRVPVVVSSDAHYKDAVGEVSRAVRMLEDIDFPRELILNENYERFLALAREKSGRKLI